MMDTVHSQDPLPRERIISVSLLIATQGDGCQGLKQQWEREEVWDQSCNGILIMTESACGSSRPLSVARHHFTVDPIHC